MIKITTKTALSILCSIGISYATTIDLAHPVSESIQPDMVYWKFDEPNGVVVANAAPSGTVYEGVLNSGDFAEPVYEAGIDTRGTSGYGSAIRLEGEPPAESVNPSVSWVGSISDTVLDLTGEDFTGGMWINFNQVNEAAQTTILLNRGTFGFKDSFSIALIRTKLAGSSTYAWAIHVSIGDAEDHETQSIACPPDAIVAGEWFHIGFNCQYDTAGTNSVTLYFNGEKLGTLDFERAIGISDGQRKLFLGERSVGTHYSLFDGRLDDFFLTSGIHEFKKPQ